jgi:hypothetical protein
VLISGLVFECSLGPNTKIEFDLQKVLLISVRLSTLEFEVRNSNLVYSFSLVQHSVTIDYLKHYASFSLERFLEKFS